MDTELCTLRSRFINVYDTDELKSKDILPFDKKGYKTISVLGSVKKFQGFVECFVLDTPEGFKEFAEKYARKNDETIRMLTPKHPKDKNVHHSGAVAERLRHCSREQRVPSSSPAWTSVLR